MLSNILCMMGGDSNMYGKKMKKKFFQGADFTNFNHGSFGGVARDVKDAQDKLFEEAEDHLDKWFRITIYKYIDLARKDVSSLINAKVEDVVLVENASSAVNSILRTYPWQKGDKVLVLSCVYRMVTEVCKWFVETQGIEIVKVEIQFPIQDKKQILEAVTAALEEHDNIKICVFDHISSMPSIVLPVEDLTAVCRSSSRNSKTLVLIDGAHAPGNVDINVERIGADYYTGNIHKWCFAPKGCAFLWTAKSRQSYQDLRPTVICSKGHREYADSYAYTGTRDYTAFASIPAAFAFCRSLGGHKAIYEYNHDLVLEGARYCAKLWDTQLIVPDEMIATMADVILPTADGNKVKTMTDALQDKYNTYIVTRDWQLTDGRTVYITRLSGQIYLEQSDFELMAARVLELLQ